jgi:MFS family permease
MRLLAGSVGSLITVLIGGQLVTYYGGSKVWWASSALLLTSAGLFAVGSASQSVPLVAAGCLALNSNLALANLPANIAAADWERHHHQPAVAICHSAYAAGSLLGALIGTLMAHLNITFGVHGGVVAAVALLGRLLARPVIAEHCPAAANPTPSSANDSTGRWLDRSTLLIGLGVFAFSYSGGSANNWIAVAVVDDLSPIESYGGLIYGAFQVAVMLCRWCGGAVINRWGATKSLYLSALVSALGITSFCLSPNLLAAGGGAVLWGLGSALSYPIGITLVSGDPATAARRVALLSAFATVAGLCAPVLTGFLGDYYGLRPALLAVLLAPALAGLTTWLQRHRP